MYVVESLDPITVFSYCIWSYLWSSRNDLAWYSRDLAVLCAILLRMPLRLPNFGWHLDVPTIL